MVEQAVPTANAILRRRLVELQTGYAKSTIYLRIAQGLFPKPVRLGARSVGWPAAEVEAVNAARIAGVPDQELAALVADLEHSRAAK